MEKKKRIILTAGIIIIIVIIAASLFFVVFQNDKNKFIGTWSVVENPAGGVTGGTFTFRDDNKFTCSDGSYGDYEVKDDKLYLTDPYGGIGGPTTACFGYEFSNGNNHLTLKYEGQIAMILNKS